MTTDRVHFSVNEISDTFVSARVGLALSHTVELTPDSALKVSLGASYDRVLSGRNLTMTYRYQSGLTDLPLPVDSGSRDALNISPSAVFTISDWLEIATSFQARFTSEAPVDLSANAGVSLRF